MHISMLIPVMGFMKKMLSGKLYMIPIFLFPKKALMIAMRWFVLAARLRKEKTFLLRLYAEFGDLVRRRSMSWKYKLSHHALLFDNKHYLYLLNKNG